MVIKKLHEIEHSEILKFGFGLTRKALNPNNLEHQNVKLVLKIFNEYVITSLFELGNKINMKIYKETTDFINIILMWWKIVNVKLH